MTEIVNNAIQNTPPQSYTSHGKKTIPWKISRRITALRFLLIVLVVFIHNNFNSDSIAEIIAAGGKDVLFNQSVVGKWVQLFVSDGLSRSAVPLFFVFASYLLFMKNDSYGSMLKKKFRSLFVPLLLWSAINLLLFVAVKMFCIRFLPAFVDNSEKFIFSGWNIRDWICAFIGFTREKEILIFSNYSVYAGNLAVQFWFIRDLLIMMLISPVIRWAVRRFPKEFLIFTSFFYVCDVRPVIVMHQAFVFFVLGCYFAEYEIDFFSLADKISWRFILPVFAISFWYFTVFTEFPSQSRWFPILCSCVIFLKLSKNIAKNEKIFNVMNFLAGYSFFLFASHNNFVTPTMQTLWTGLLPMRNGFFCLAEYFGVTTLVVFFCTGSGIILKKICPHGFRLLNGGRG